MLSGLYSMVGCVTELWSATSCWVVTNVMPLLFFFLDSLLVVSCSFARLVLGTGKGNRETRREGGRIKKSWRRSGEEKEGQLPQMRARSPASPTWLLPPCLTLLTRGLCPSCCCQQTPSRPGPGASYDRKSPRSPFPQVDI